MSDLKNTDYIFDIEREEGYNYSFLELPVFNRDRKIGEGINKKYILNAKENSYVETKAAYFEKEDEYRNINEFDEKIFYGIIRLYWETRNDVIITDYFEILRSARIAYNGATFKRVTEGLQRLLKTNIVLNNISGLKNGIVNLINELKVVEREKNTDDDEQSEEIAAKFFRNSKIKRIVMIRLNPIITEELKRIDVENLNILKKLNSKKIYILIQKWFEFDKSLVIEKKFAEIAAFLPFNWSKTSVSRTMKYIMDAFDELRENDMIRKYENIRVKPNSESIIKFQINEKFFCSGEEDIETKNYNESLRKIIKESNLFLKEFTREMKKIAKAVAINESLLKKEMLTKLFTKIHTIKGIAKYVRLEEIYILADEIEKKVDKCMNENEILGLDVINGIAKSVEKIHKICEIKN